MGCLQRQSLGILSFAGLQQDCCPFKVTRYLIAIHFVFFAGILPPTMGTSLIHIVDRFDVPWSGSALSALSLHDLLSPEAETRLWSPDKPHACYQAYPIRTIEEEAGVIPQSGTLIIHGNHFELG